MIGSENEWKGNEYLMSGFEENKLKHVMEQEMHQEIAHVTIDQEIAMIQDQLMVILDQDMIKGNINLEHYVTYKLLRNSDVILFQ